VFNTASRTKAEDSMTACRVDCVHLFDGNYG